MITCFIVCPITITRTRGGFVALSPISPQELFLQSMSSDTDAAQQQNLVSKEQLFVHIMTVIYTSAEPPKLNNLELMPIFLGKICQTWCHHLANLVWLQSREHCRQCHCIIFFKSSHWPAQPWGAHKCWRVVDGLQSCFCHVNTLVHHQETLWVAIIEVGCDHSLNGANLPLTDLMAHAYLWS